MLIFYCWLFYRIYFLKLYSPSFKNWSFLSFFLEQMTKNVFLVCMVSSYGSLVIYTVVYRILTNESNLVQYERSRAWWNPNIFSKEIFVLKKQSHLSLLWIIFWANSKIFGLKSFNWLALNPELDKDIKSNFVKRQKLIPTWFYFVRGHVRKVSKEKIHNQRAYLQTWPLQQRNK